MSIFVQRPDIRKHEKNKHSHFFFCCFLGQKQGGKSNWGVISFAPWREMSIGSCKGRILCACVCALQCVS